MDCVEFQILEKVVRINRSPYKTLSSQEYYLIVILVLGSIYGQVLGLTYIILMPLLARDFSISHNTVQMGMAFYFIGFSVSQLFAGTLVYRFGRRGIFLVGLIISLCGTLIIIFNYFVTFLFCGLFFQAFGVGFVIPLNNAMVTEDFDAALTKPLYSLINSALAIGGILTPIFAGYSSHLLSWKITFVFVLIFGALLTSFAFLFLPKSIFANQVKIVKRSILENIKYGLRSSFDIKAHPAFRYMFIYSSLLVGSATVYNATIPIILHTHFYFNSGQIGMAFFAFNIANITGLIIAALLKFRNEKWILLAAVVIIFSNAIYLWIFATDNLTWIKLIVPFVITGFAIGLATPYYWILALSTAAAESRIYSAALIIFGQNMVSAFIATIIAVMHERHIGPLSIILMLLSFLAMLALLKFKNPK